MLLGSGEPVSDDRLRRAVDLGEALELFSRVCLCVCVGMGMSPREAKWWPYRYGNTKPLQPSMCFAAALNALNELTLSLSNQYTPHAHTDPPLPPVPPFSFPRPTQNRKKKPPKLLQAVVPQKSSKKSISPAFQTRQKFPIASSIKRAALDLSAFQRTTLNHFRSSQPTHNSPHPAPFTFFW